jgi:hypothetical protein
MIRSNLVTLLIIASLGWVVDGYAEAARPITPKDSTGETIQQLLRITGVSQKVQDELALEPRVLMRKPMMIERAAGDEQTRLLIKFTDQVRMRTDSIGEIYSKSGQDIDSIAVIMSEMNLTLEPVFSGPEARITELLNRAEKNSGQAQPDLAGIFYVKGNNRDVDGAAMILLHDPRVEWAGYRNGTFNSKTLSDRIDDAVDTQRKQDPSTAVAAIKAERSSGRKSDVPQINLINAKNPTTRLGMMGDTASAAIFGNQVESNERVPVGNDLEGEERLGIPPACCVNGQDTTPTLSFNPSLGSPVGPLVFRACVPVVDEDACDDIDGAFIPGATCLDPVINTFVVCEVAATAVDPEWEPLGACCAAGVQTYAVRSECAGQFMHDEYARFSNASYPSATVGALGLTPSALNGTLADDARIPAFNGGLNMDLMSKIYGFQNMVVPGGNILTAQAETPAWTTPNAILNSNYSYYTGNNLQLSVGGASGPAPNLQGNFIGVGTSSGVAASEPIFLNQNATFPYGPNTGIMQAMFSTNGPGPNGGGPTGGGYDPFNLYPGADPTVGAALGPWTILWGPVDIAVNSLTGEAIPAINNTGPGQNNPNGITGGFSFYVTSPSLAQNVFDPNMYLAAPDDGLNFLCNFGVCAMDCWQPEQAPPGQGCGPETSFAGFPFLGRAPQGAGGGNSAVLESPIISPLAQVPNTNVGCSNFVYEDYCGALTDRTTVSELNASGSLWADLNQLPLTSPIIGGCQTTNSVFIELWWKANYEAQGNECVIDGSPGYETYAPGEGADPLKGSCFYSNMNYPAMFINQYSEFQLQAFGGVDQLNGGNGNQFEFFYEPCYGGNNGESQYCPTYCAVNPAGLDNALPDAVCAVAPICCDQSFCAGGPINPYDSTLTYQELSGWSFICADLANQYKIDAFSDEINNPTYNTIDPFPPVANVSSLINPGNASRRRNLDFDQINRINGPFNSLNVMGLQPPYARNADGSIWDDPNIAGNDPTLIAPPLNCMINYGIQNQCFTTYFSQFQPSLGLAAPSVLPPFNKQQNGGCMDFQCCHTVCSIVFNPLTDDFNYGNCCDPQFGWTEECVDKAIELCYENEGGVQTTRTPNFVPLQFHLSQRTAAGPQPFRLFDQATRRLATAPTLPPTVVSSIPGLPTFPADNWLQSADMVQWVVNGQRGDDGVPLQDTWAAPSVLGLQSTAGVKYGIQYDIDELTGTPVPRLSPQQNVANNWQQFYYGEPISPPPTFYESQGLSLYGTMDTAGWGGNPARLTPTTGLFSWADFLLSLQESNGPAGPNNIGAYGFGVNIAVLDTSAWIQEYVNAQGQTVGAVHEDLGNVLMEGPATGDEFIPMGFEPFIFEPQRGTAVLGTIAASQNGFGTTGIAIQSNTMFFPVVTANLGDREFNAWLSAMTHLKPGDIMIPTYPGGGGTDNIWLDRGGEGTLLELLINLTAALDITVILPMGDFGISAGSLLETLPSNVLNVGGSMPSTLPKRAWSSNYADEETTVPTICSMTPITTTGGDCNLTRAAIRTNPDQPTDPPGYISREMQARSYTNDFGYLFDSSKAAAAQIAGVAACLQGVSMQWYGASQPGSNMAAIISSNPRRIGGMINGPATLETTYSSAPLESTGWQYGLTSTDGGLTQNIGLMVDPARAGVDMVINPVWNVTGPADILLQAEFIRGFQIAGDYLSLEEKGDGNEMVGYSQFTYTFFDYQPDFFVPGAPFNYNASFDFANQEAGEVTDLFIHGQATNKELTEEDSLAFDVQMTLAPDPEEAPIPATSLLIGNSPFRQGFVYNYVLEAWILMENTVTAYPLFSYEPPGGNDGLVYLGFEGAFDLRLVLSIPTDVFDDEAFLNEYAVFYDYVSLKVSGPIDP